ncbi:MAG: V-type proton ATPase subunit E [Gemmatimonadota bacterium]|nr:V-type proton ATPase subunit E [Gemmatimonadota bacterium]MDH5283011.1 V-type proton ATPase subunit E [Gemmatimonadota bacterium]
MALEKLLEVLRREAEAEVAAIQAAARAEAEASLARCDADLAARRASFETERDAVRQTAVELALGVARRDARRAVLEARERLLDRVFTAARSQFAGVLPRAEYRAGLPGQLDEAARCLGGRGATVRCHPALRKELEPLVGSHPSLRLAADTGAGSGFKVASEDGAVEIDATLEDRLARSQERVRQEVMAALESHP